MSATIQHADALALLAHLEYQLLKQPTYLITYNEAAVVLGKRNPTYCGRHVGQVASRLDAACLAAGVPFLGMHRVRQTVGYRLNLRSFDDDVWAPYLPQLVARARAHTWTKEDFKRIRTELNRFDGAPAATILWKRIEDNGAEALLRALGQP